ncbi:hypothetical protein JZ751_022422, partial [Albula glossodonta]
LQNGTDYGYLVRQNSELLRALEELEKTCATLKEENGLLRKSSCPETEEKVKRLKRKNAELAVIAKRLEDRARKLQEANLKVVNAPAPVKAGAVEQYKRAFARQRARDLAQHADTLLSKDKEIAALQQECRELQARLGPGKGSPSPSGMPEFERLLRESQREVLRLQRQLSVSSTKEPLSGGLHDKVGAETPLPVVDEAPAGCEEAHSKAEEELQKPPVTPEPEPYLTPNQTPCLPQEAQSEGQRLQFLESELSKKRKECESLEHEVRKRQKRCLDLESQLEDERGRNERLVQEADHLRQKAQLLSQIQVENEVLRGDISELTAQRNSVLEENQRLRAKLENLEQVLKHMREVAERRQQLELEHEQALAVLKFKQDEIKRLQRAQFFAKREHEGVVQMLEELTQLVLQRELSRVRELEEKCRSQSEQFGLLSQELERFRLQTGKMDMASSQPNAGLSHLTNGIGLGGEKDLGPTARPMGVPHTAGLGKTERSPTSRHRELPTISVKSGSTSSTPKSESKHLTPKSESLPHSPRKSSPTHEVDTASEVEELDIDVSPIPYPGSRVAAKLQVFIARYSYNPYDGPNDSPEVELPLTAGEYIYVYGDMDDDGFYEGELMDGRRGLVPSNFVERVSDDDMMSLHPPEAGDLSHSSFQESSFHSEKHLRFSLHSSERTEPSATAADHQGAPAGGKGSGSGPAPLTNGLDLDMEEVGLDSVPYPRKLTLIKQLAKSIIIGWDPPLVPAGWGSIWSYNVFVDKELRLNVPFGSQTKAVLERLDINLRSYRVSVQSLTDKGASDQVRCSLLVGRDVSVAPTQLQVEQVSATSANLTWLPSNSNYVHVVFLNDEERELVKAGSYSLCLSNLEPNRQYRVKVEARPHRTPWELPLEQREQKTATTTFTTLMAGPPDAPLDVQLEPGPSPGIALVSWLPVTIDAAGTSNGVRVTGYTIYADKNKVLEVSSPTAGSALLGPSQIHALQASSELTVRTMSPHGESANSVPVKILPKLGAIATGLTSPRPIPPSYPAASPDATAATHPPTDTFSAKMPMLIHTPPLEAAKGEPSYAKAWADPTSAAALLPGTSPVPCEASNTTSDHCSNLTVNVSLSSGTDGALESSREPESPGAKRPPVSLSDFLDEAVSSAEPSTPLTSSISPALPLQPPPMPVPPPAAPEPAPEIDPLNPPDTHPLRPIQPSPLESETEDDSGRENARMVSIEEFLDQGMHRRVHFHGQRRQQDYTSAQLEPLSEYHAESSRGSDLSDILEEEEEDLYSDPTGEERSRGYSIGAAAREARGNGDPQLADATTAWYGQNGGLVPKQAHTEARQLKDGQQGVEPNSLVAEGEVRIFVALFPYDPAIMSPNPDATEEELPFKEGQIIKVYGDKDADGFYRGESGGRLGYVPCNMVSEIQVEDQETRDQLLQQGFLTTEASMDKIGTRSHAQLPRRPVPPPKPRRSKKVESASMWEGSVDSSGAPSQPASVSQSVAPRRMVAVFDYDPRESSPNADVEAELTFSAGDIIYVFGDMDDDGFFYGDLNGQKGLVPSNFLQALPVTDDEVAQVPTVDHGIAESRRESQVSLSMSEEQLAPPLVREEEPPPASAPPPDPTPSTSPPQAPPSESPIQTDTSPPGKKKKGFFSKGKKLFKKLGSSKKD